MSMSSIYSHTSNIRKFIGPDFVKRSYYDYNKVEYKGSSVIKIICKKHGEFEQISKVHLKSGCPICKMSHGERKIYKYLIEHNISFKREKI